MNKKYYEMNVIITGTVRIPVDNYDGKDCAIECVEMTNDITDIAQNIQVNNDKEFFIIVDKSSVKEVEI